MIRHVSGAGPAGLAAALTIAKTGQRAVVYERRDDVGSRFHGDFQGIENWTTDGNVLDELAAIGIEVDFECAPVHRATFFDPHGEEHRYETKEPLFYLVRRGSQPGTLDHSLKRQALAAGVEIRFGETCRHLPEGGVVAEGPHGSDAIAVGYVFDTTTPDCVFGATADELAPKGYSYLLVQGGRGTMASCMFEDFHNEKDYLRRTVSFFEERTGIEIRNPRRFGGTGNFRVPRSARRGNMLLAGEAAGFQDSLWGFGMRYALISGHLAGKCVAEGRPEAYDPLWKHRLGGLMRAAVVNRYLYERLGNGGYRRFFKQVDRASDARVWLGRRYAPTPLRSLLFPLASWRVRAARKAAAAAADAACPGEGCDCTWCRCRRELGIGRASESGSETLVSTARSDA